LKTPLNLVGLVMVAGFIGSVGMAFLKAGSGRLEFEVRALITNWQIAAGIGLYGLSSIFYTIAVRQGELTVLYPMVSLGYVWALLWARLFFNERLTKMKFAGLGMILAGIVLLFVGR
jgi:multidrug transporter EmrE-like cation transporter